MTAGLVQIASCLAFLGDPETARKVFERAMMLNPYCEPWYYAYGGFIEIVGGNEEAGITLALQAPLTSVWLDLPAVLALACANLGREEEAAKYRTIFEEAFREKITPGRTPEPGEALQWLVTVNPFKKPEDAAAYLQGLRRAGFSETVAESPSPATADSPAPSREATFRQKGELREFAFGGKRGQLPEVKGFGDLERLLADPGTEVHCSDLMGMVSSSGPADEIMDARARSDCAARIRELQADLDQAESDHDWGRKLGYEQPALDAINQRAIAELERFRREEESLDSPMPISGCMGPRGDGYVPSRLMTAREAEVYHEPQVRAFADSATDQISALTPMARD